MSDPRSRVTIGRALEVAADLNVPTANRESEYMRGQAELICDLFSISTDHKETVIEMIAVIAERGI